MIAPPSNGPTATAPPIVAPQSAIARWRMCPSNSWPIRASDVVNIAAPPIPCTARARSSASGLPARPHPSDETVKTASPPRKTLLREKRSASVPADSSSAESVSA